MTSSAYEVNIDGLVGPTHTFAGLSKGNMASMENAGSASNPKAAALQGLNKMKQMADYGYKQLILPPHERPHLPTLRAFGYSGADNRIPGKVHKENPELLYQYSSAAAMFAANAASATPSIDSQDNRVHLTPANKAAMPHRIIEAEMTSRFLKAIFPTSTFFTIHSPLPVHPHYHDEGAANHIRFYTDPRYVGIHLFVYGKVGKQGDHFKERKFTPRQTLEAQEAIVRLHRLNLSQVVFAKQSTEALNEGVFHNDLISMGCSDLFIYHEQAFSDPESTLIELNSKFNDICDQDLQVIKVSNEEIPLKAAIKSYFFNSQMIKLPDGGFVLFCPRQCQTHQDVSKYLARHLKDPDSPIADIHYVELDQCMRNGGGPACMRFSVVMTETELEHVNPKLFLTDRLYEQLSEWINKHYRDSLTLDDLADPSLVDETQEALQKLTQILDLGHIYDFQR